MRGKLIENCKFQTVLPARPYTQANSSTTYGRTIDTNGVDEVVFNLDAENLLANNTLAVVINENSTPDPIGSVAVTGASFTTITSSNGTTGRSGTMQSSEFKRYLFAIATFSGGGGAFTGSAAMSAVLKSRTAPVAGTPDFDLDYL